MTEKHAHSLEHGGLRDNPFRRAMYAVMYRVEPIMKAFGEEPVLDPVFCERRHPREINASCGLPAGHTGNHDTGPPDETRLLWSRGEE